MPECGTTAFAERKFITKTFRKYALTTTGFEAEAVTSGSSLRAIDGSTRPKMDPAPASAKTVSTETLFAPNMTGAIRNAPEIDQSVPSTWRRELTATRSGLIATMTQPQPIVLSSLHCPAPRELLIARLRFMNWPMLGFRQRALCSQT